MAEPTFQQLTEQVRKLTQRVAALEHELKLRAPPAPATLTASQTRNSDLEQRFGLKFVNRVGAVTLILGIAFFFRYAVENNWIGETARVLWGLFGGLVLLSAGELWFRRGQSTFAQGISGTGAAILYLSCYVAFDAYHFISLPIALGALVGVTAIAAALAVRYKSQAFAILALCGGLLVPVLLHPNPFSPWFVPVYIAVLDAAFLLLARHHSWQGCAWLALTGTILSTLDMSEQPLQWLTPVYYALFCLHKNHALFVASHCLLLLRVCYPAVFPPELLAMSAAGVAVLLWRKWNHLAPWLVIAVALCWAVGSTQLQMQPALSISSALFFLFLTTLHPIALPMNAAFLFAASYQRLHGWGDGWAALIATAMAVVYFALAWRISGLLKIICGITAHVLLLTAIGLEVVRRLGYTNAASAAISICFAMYAVALVAAGTAMRAAENRYLGLGLIALVVAKLYLNDVWQLDTAYRFIAFAALGALLLTMSFLYSRYRNRIATWLTSPAASEAHPPQPPE